jgi:hypothetical protein
VRKGNPSMGDYPIIFSGPMVRALLDGRKTMTRRIPTPTWRKVAPGERLWVRECGARYHTVNHIARQDGRAFSEISDGLFGYRADGHDGIEDMRRHIKVMSDIDLEAIEIENDRWRPSIHMPRWASRLTLAVTATKVERLKSISEEDAQAEGIARLWPIGHSCDTGPNHFTISIDGASYSRPTAAETFRVLWETLHGEESWEKNPELIALTFTVHKVNIDQMKEAA